LKSSNLYSGVVQVSTLNPCRISILHSIHRALIDSL
jgi:hypothetical protein